MLKALKTLTIAAIAFAAIGLTVVTQGCAAC
jgi:hypothetical protein